MYIERLHLKGFKSFGNSQDLVFSPGFTAIVGPNGSGKSNLLDALRWILGDGGFQRLRITRQGDLLFSGSASVAVAPRTEVNLLIKEKESPAGRSMLLKKTYSPETGAVVTVDGVRIRLADLDEVKRRWKLEGDQFAFISQGEVAEAIRQRPSQRRSHLELLFGIDQYRRRRDETFGKLVSAEEESLRLTDLTAELSRRREEIAPAAALAARAREITDRLEENQKTSYFHRRSTLEQGREALRLELLEQESREELMSRWRALWERGRQKYAELEDLSGDALRGLNEWREKILIRREELRRSSFASGATVKEIRSRLRTLGDDKKALALRIGEALSEREELLIKNRELSDEFERAAREREALIGRARELQEAALRERRRKRALNEEIASLEAEKEGLSSRKDSREAFLAEWEGRIARSLKTLEERKVEKSLLDERVSALEEKGARALDAHGEAFAAGRKTAAALQRIKKEFLTLEGEAEDLKAAETSSYPEPVRFLTSAYRLGRLQIPLIAAAEAFTAPPAVTAALEAYLGGRQYWLFVKTLGEAGRCIDLLKERRAGRATFLPLEKCRPRFPHKKAILPGQGVVGWAGEIVAADKEWESCVAHLLGDLLLVEDYSTGAGLASQRVPFPVASLDGEVFLPSGTVSGGKTRTVAGAIERRRRISEAEGRLEELKKEISFLSAALEKEEALERRRAAEKEELAAELRELKRQSGAVAEEITLEGAAAGRLKGERDKALSEKKAMEDRIAAIAGELARLRGSLGEAPDGEEDLSLSSKLAEEEGAFALLKERLSGAAVLSGKAAEEIERLKAREGRLEVEEREALGRERAEMEKLKAAGFEEREVFLKLKEGEAKLRELRAGEKIRARRLATVLAKDRSASEAAARARERSAALKLKFSTSGDEIGQLVEIWEEKYPYSPEEAPSHGEGEAASATVRRLERELRNLGEVEWGALSEDQSLKSRITYLSEQSRDVEGAMDQLRDIITETDRHVAVLFQEALGGINDRFNALFRRLFGGGEARLRLQEDDSSLESGVEIVARPPGKHLQNLAQLSGGEQSLTAIAYLFASMEVAGVPLAVLDEVDAALDEANLLRFGDLARDYASPREGNKGIQLIVMTHRRATMERADILYGVTLAEPGLSKVVGMKVDDWAEPEALPSGVRGGRP